MTTLHDAVEIDRTKPGWLRRAWEVEQPPWPGGGFLLAGRIPEILEPFIKDEPAPGLEEGNLRILDFEGLDSEAAALLLEALPERALELDLSGYAPPAGITLRAIVDHPGVILGGGSVVSPELHGEALQLRELTINDPALLDLPPDVVPAELPEWIGELPEAAYQEYLDAREWCLQHGVTRQAWILAVQRYGIAEARRFPQMRILTDSAGVTSGVWFAW